MGARMSELRVGAPFVSPELTIVPIEAIRRDSWIARAEFCVSAFKEPVAIVLLTRSETKAVDMSGAEVDVDELAAEVPGLRELLEARAETR
jgi:hypothetical protein